MRDMCRNAMLAMLQRIASGQQGVLPQAHPSPSPCPSASVPSSAAVALQQRQLQQLLYQQPQHGRQGPFSQQKPTAAAQAAAAFGSWPWQSPASAASATATVTQPCFSTPFFVTPPEDASALVPDQQACPQLDGSFLAECIKSSAPLTCVNSCNQSIQRFSQLPPSNRQVLSANHVPAAAAAVALPVQVKADKDPSASILSPTLSFSSVPSTQSSLTAVSSLSASPEAELPADLHSADGSFDTFGTCSYASAICMY